MRFEILDVGHGFCAYAETDNQDLILFDCGSKSDPAFRPSDYLYQRGRRSVERLFISNFDEDHISDLPQVQRNLRTGILHRNRSISPEELRRLKLQTGPITPAMSTLLHMMQEYTETVTNPPPLPDFEWTSYCHSYGADFDDTNNLSLVTFIRVRTLNVILPGDLEKAGWEMHLKNPAFRTDLQKVGVFVASHHGRENGYCSEVFQYCKPSVIVISDGPKQFATQEMVNTYGSHSTGVRFNGELRKVLTTRTDGNISWTL